MSAAYTFPDVDTGRSTAEVMADHLARREEGDLDGDLRENYSESVVVISHEETGYGHEAVRRTASVLEDLVDATTYQVVQLEALGRIAYLRWRGDGKEGIAEDGVDTFVVEDGKITAQTIHYSVADR